MKSLILPIVSFLSLTTGFSLSVSARYPLATSVACIGVSATSCASARLIQRERTTVAKRTAGRNEKDLFTKSLLPSERAPHQLGIVTIYREGRSELLGFDPVVTESESVTISDTSLVSGSINMIRPGSFTKSSCFV